MDGRRFMHCVWCGRGLMPKGIVAKKINRKADGFKRIFDCFPIVTHRVEKYDRIYYASLHCTWSPLCQVTNNFLLDRFLFSAKCCTSLNDKGIRPMSIFYFASCFLGFHCGKVRETTLSASLEFFWRFWEELLGWFLATYTDIHLSTAYK